MGTHIHYTTLRNSLQVHQRSHARKGDPPPPPVDSDMDSSVASVRSAPAAMFGTMPPAHSLPMSLPVPMSLGRTTAHVTSEGGVIKCPHPNCDFESNDVEQFRAHVDEAFPEGADVSVFLVTDIPTPPESHVCVCVCVRGVLQRRSSGDATQNCPT